jgi:hypothetical protein
MKAVNVTISIALLVLSTHLGFAQGRAISGNGFDSGEIKIIPKTDPAKKVAKTVKTIEYIAVSPERVWHSSDSKQKPITGSLLAFERQSKTGKVSIVRQEKVRLLVGKKDFTLPLTKLSLDDQAFVQNLVDSARIAGKLIETEAVKKPSKIEAGASEQSSQGTKPAE